MAVDVGSAKGYLDLDISGFLAGLKSAQSEADTASKNIATKIGKNLTGVGKSISSVGSTLTKTVTVPLLGIGAAGLKVATDFEKGMSQVKAISGATGKEFDALKEKAIELGANTAFSAGEVAEAMTEMAKAGWDSQQIIDGMAGVLDAAAASGEGLAAVSTIVADTITGFGLAASDSSKIADLLTQAANSGTIGIAELGESFKYIAPVASSMGLSVEDVTTAISAMSMAGIKGSQAGTSLRTMLTRMVKPTDDVASAMSELGLELTNSDGTFKSLDDIVAMMRGSFDGLTDEQKTYYATVLAGQEGMSGMLSLLNLTEEEYNKIAESMDNAGGVAQQTAEIMQDNLQSKVEQLLGSLESLAIKLADYILPHLQKFVEWITQLIEKFTALDPETQKTILKFAGLALAAGPVILAIGKITSGIGGLLTTFGKVGPALKTFSEGFKLARAGFPALGAEASKFGAMLGGIIGPLLAIVAAVALVVGAFVSLWKNNEEFRNNITAIWNQIKETFNGFVQGIIERINKLGFDFKSIGEIIKAIWKGLCDFLAPIFQGAFQQISNTFSFITNTILSVLDFFIAIFKGDWQGAWNAVKSILSNIGNFIVNTFKNSINTAKEFISTGINKIKSLFNFKWSFPKLKMPHFSIKGKFSLSPPSVPYLSIDWYKKAMSGGMILNSPTIFGYDSKSGQLLGGGEAGSETVVGTASLLNMIRQSVSEVIKPMIEVTRELARKSIELGYVTYNGFAKQNQVLEKVVAAGGISGGDTFNFYSPKAIDEIEAAKQMKNAKRDLAEDF